MKKRRCKDSKKRAQVEETSLSPSSKWARGPPWRRPWRSSRSHAERHALRMTKWLLSLGRDERHKATFPHFLRIQRTETHSKQIQRLPILSDPLSQSKRNVTKLMVLLFLKGTQTVPTFSRTTDHTRLINRALDQTRKEFFFLAETLENLYLLLPNILWALFYFHQFLYSF